MQVFTTTDEPPVRLQLRRRRAKGEGGQLWDERHRVLRRVQAAAVPESIALDALLHPPSPRSTLMILCLAEPPCLSNAILSLSYRPTHRIQHHRPVHVDPAPSQAKLEDTPASWPLGARCSVCFLCINSALLNYLYRFSCVKVSAVCCYVFTFSFCY